MPIIEKHKYLSKNGINYVSKENLVTLTFAELASIANPDAEVYNGLYELLNRCASETDKIEIITDMSGMLHIQVPLNFDRHTFHSLADKRWNGYWCFSDEVNLKIISG
jgi:hypothetical protein